MIFQMADRRHMRLKVCLKTLLIVALTTTVYGQVKQTRLERDLFQLQDEWLEACVKGDTSRRDRLEATDFISVDGDGKVTWKVNRNIVKSNPFYGQTDSLDTMESRILVFKNGAVIIGQLWVKRRIDDQM